MKKRKAVTKIKRKPVVRKHDCLDTGRQEIELKAMRILLGDEILPVLRAEYSSYDKSLSPSFYQADSMLRVYLRQEGKAWKLCTLSDWKAETNCPKLMLIRETYRTYYDSDVLVTYVAPNKKKSLYIGGKRRASISSLNHWDLAGAVATLLNGNASERFSSEVQHSCGNIELDDFWNPRLYKEPRQVNKKERGK